MAPNLPDPRPSKAHPDHREHRKKLEKEHPFTWMPGVVLGLMGVTLLMNVEKDVERREQRHRRENDEDRDRDRDRDRRRARDRDRDRDRDDDGRRGRRDRSYERRRPHSQHYRDGGGDGDDDDRRRRPRRGSWGPEVRRGAGRRDGSVPVPDTYPSPSPRDVYYRDRSRGPAAASPAGPSHPPPPPARRMDRRRSFERQRGGGGGGDNPPRRSDTGLYAQRGFRAEFDGDDRRDFDGGDGRRIYRY
ncbi:uncharacterized protein E0L32_006552 [Thyridium curvatum]|uniref:Uncharacterized protein n=1 Tax=Thyridium curvatum TaxID=1093900 RepID=A0A507B235_9PEZI|nr:uncharacterized protein E0L32_006552 [Thyridium curvatum]TPX13126.1 hypothetical protein E0L32_006552 [Thyridium curvatum]